MCSLKMELINKELILKEIPLFASLSEEELELIQDKSDIIDYKKGEIIYQEGSTPDAFYCVISGREHNKMHRELSLHIRIFTSGKILWDYFTSYQRASFCNCQGSQ